MDEETCEEEVAHTIFLPISVNDVPVLLDEGNGIFCVDNFQLKSPSRGLAFRWSKDIDDKVEGCRAEWGTKVIGIDEGDGWIRVTSECDMPFDGNLSDGSEASQVSESEFGLSNWQLENIWQDFGSRAMEISLDDDDNLNRRDSDFGISERQLELLASMHANNAEGDKQHVDDKQTRPDPRKPASVDPLQYFKSQRVQKGVAPRIATDVRSKIGDTIAETPGTIESKGPLACSKSDVTRNVGYTLKSISALGKDHQESTVIESTTSDSRKQEITDPLRHFLKNPAVDKALGATRLPNKPRRDSLILEQLPIRRRKSLLAAASLAIPRVSLVSSQDVNGTIWYLFRVYDQGEERFYMKRYNAFKKLHNALLDSGRFKELPEFPRSGDGLEKYARDLLTAFHSLRNEPLLECFFGPDARGRVLNDS